jgi:hypothetical protein
MSVESPVSAVGILPVGALGVAFFHHLTRETAGDSGRVFFVERAGSASAATLREKGRLFVADGTATRALPAAEFCRPNLSACGDAGTLPEVLLVCTQVDQLLPVIGEYVVLLERLYAAHGLDAALERLPVLILCSNGIYHERVRRFLVESLEESMLYGRLPDLWSEPMGRIVGQLLRGVSIQTGHRTGYGAEAVFHPGPRGRTTLAGGDPAKRRRCAELLSSLGGWFEDAGTTPPVRVEFDKALINLWGNLLGQLKAIDAQGHFRLLKVREIFPEDESEELRELAWHVVAVGRAVRAYRDDEDFEQIYRSALRIAAGPRDHVPSSIKWLEAQLAAGTLTPQLAPTEAWLLDPLTRFARTAGLEDSALYFSSLRERLEERLRLAASAAAVTHAAP